MARVYIETYGCALNRSDSLVMKHFLKSRGHSMVDEASEADVIIVNTCTVRSESESRCLRRALELQRVNPRAKIIVAGCIPEAQPYTVKSVLPKASLVGPYRVHEIHVAVESSRPVNLIGASSVKRDIIAGEPDGCIATLALNDGCLGKCSFCITRVARRRLVSRRPEKIVEAVKSLVERGVYEIQLSSQDAGVYGIDLTGRQMLPELLEDTLSRVEGEYAIRIAMMNPEWASRIIDDLIRIYRDKHVYKFLHIPLQSGDDEVLRIMRRGYTVDEYISLVMEFKRKIPNLYLVTDIMVGHPGETEEAFENTLEVVRRVRFDRMHIARYTPRPHTLSARMKQVPEGVKKERSRRLMKLYEEIGLERNKMFIGRVVEGVVVEENVIGGRRTYTVRSISYDSIVVPWSPNVKLGSRVRVYVNDATFFDLRGVVVE